MLKKYLEKNGYKIDDEGFYYTKKLHKYPNVISNIYVVGERIIRSNCDCSVEYIVESKREQLEINKIIKECLTQHYEFIQKVMKHYGSKE